MLLTTLDHLLDSTLCQSTNQDERRLTFYWQFTPSQYTQPVLPRFISSEQVRRRRRRPERRSSGKKARQGKRTERIILAREQQQEKKASEKKVERRRQKEKRRQNLGIFFISLYALYTLLSSFIILTAFIDSQL